MASGSRLWGALLLLPLLLPAASRADGGCSGEGGPLEPFDELYASGVEAYYSGDFAGAARCLERALRSRRELRDARLRCRRRCRGQVRLEAPGPGAGGDLPFFGSVLRRASCLRSCEEPRLGAVSRHRAAEEVRADFQRRVPYSYLQRAYIQCMLQFSSQVELSAESGSGAVLRKGSKSFGVALVLQPACAE
ncbi:hypothetical protein Q9233_002300 [Columba guinea]|nr:hypothetical protein Q9233_002300 [Columba guinea]